MCDILLVHAKVKSMGFVKNINVEEQVESSFEKALKILDNYIVYNEAHIDYVQVRSMSKQDTIYKVYGALSEWACCTSGNA